MSICDIFDKFCEWINNAKYTAIKVQCQVVLVD